MSTLTVWEFDTVDGADNALVKLQELQRQQLIEVIDGAVVTYPQGAKKPKTRQLNHPSGAFALGGAFWGFLFGLIFFVPFLGMAVGAGMGALMGSLTDVGINDDFIKQTRQKITPGTSALFLYTGRVVQDRVIDEFKKLPGNPELLQSNLSKEQEAKLREAFGEEAEEGQAEPVS
jgi:uncharacterized membrane protein